MRESDIERHLVKRVKALGGEVRKVQWIGRRGAPDRLVMLPYSMKNGIVEYTPRSIWIELKATGKVPERHQQREHDILRGFGQCVVVIDCMEGVDALLA